MSATQSGTVGRLSEMQGPALRSRPESCAWLKAAWASSTARSRPLGLTWDPLEPQPVIGTVARARKAATKRSGTRGGLTIAIAMERIAEVSRALLPGVAR